jgi:peptidoglycan/LPS O-acetylase OafA/YrhL
MMKWIVNFTGLWLLSTVGTIIASILISIGLASALHVIIEAPLIGRARKWSSMRRDWQGDRDAPGPVPAHRSNRGAHRDPKNPPG